MGFTYLYGYGNYSAAKQNMQAAIQHGGFALFRVRHDRYDGTFSNSSLGWLRVSSGSVAYASSNSGDSFSFSRGSIQEAAMNSQVRNAIRRFWGSAERAYQHQNNSSTAVGGAFHIRADSRSYNLVGTSSDPAAEARLILNLLNR
jgi:hypothetical protein